MNAKTFLAMLRRDAHVARRNFVTLLLQTLFQPMLLVFVFGKVMTSSGLIRPEYKGMLLPGIIALAMLLSGVWSVAMPLVPSALVNAVRMLHARSTSATQFGLPSPAPSALIHSVWRRRS